MTAPEMAAGLADRLAALGLTLATAESCTGGLIAHTLTNQPGSSVWFKGGIVAYANEIKTALLGVPTAVLDAHGAVSEQTVRLMAEGARTVLKTDCALAVSGIAGPGGGTPDKPVGLVWMAWAGPTGVTAARLLFQGDRLAIKTQTAAAAIAGLLDRLS